METTVKTDLSSIYNYLLLGENIATGGQPDEFELQLLADQGFVAVVNLGLTETEYALVDEATLVAALGLTYYHIPVIWDGPTHEDFSRFVACMTNLSDKKRFIHCAANKRVSVFMSLYNTIYCGKSYNDGLKDIEIIWQPNAVWQKFINDVLNYSG